MPVLKATILRLAQCLSSAIARNFGAMTEEIHFVTGKGGTGKSVLAAGLALREARKGRKTLLVELGDRSFYKDFFSLPAVDYQPTPFEKNLDIARWSGLDALREYAIYLVKVERLVKLFFENSVSRSLIEIAPAPSLAVNTRRRLYDAALRLAAAANYRNLGTFEFLVDAGDADGNARLAFIEATGGLH